MERETITVIINTVGEYRKYSESLLDIMECFAEIGKNTEIQERTVRTAAENIGRQIRELNHIAQAMEEIVSNYKRMHADLSNMEIGLSGEYGDAEFGISEFSSLSKHERIMPIHSS